MKNGNHSHTSRWNKVLSLILAGSMMFSTGSMQVLAESTESAQTQAAEMAAPETSAPETAAPETAAPETSAPETAAPETSAPETAAPETSAPETNAPETASPETASSETPSTVSTETNATEKPSAASESETASEPESETSTEEQALQLRKELEDGTVITVSAPAGALPEGTELKVDPEDLKKSASPVLDAMGYGALVDQLDDVEDLSKLIASYTISFVKDGQETAPKSAVSVKIENTPVDMTRFGGNYLNLWKIKDGKAEKIATSESGSTTIDFEMDQKMQVAIAGVKPSGSTGRRGPRKAMAAGSRPKTGVDWFDNTVISVSSHITAEKPKISVDSDGKALEDGTYSGTLTASIPASEMFGWLGAHLNDTIMNTKVSDFYPHGDGKNIIGGVVMEAAFPAGTVIGDVTVDKGTNAFSKYALHAGTFSISNEKSSGCTGDTYTNKLSYNGESNAESIFLTFTDQNFEGIYSTYNSNPGAIVTITIPYSFTLKAGDVLPGQATVQGQTWSHITRNQNPAYIYSDVFSGDIAEAESSEPAAVYSAVYQFVSADGTALPQAVLDRLPSDADDEGNAKTYSSVDELEKANPIALTDDQKTYTDTSVNPAGRVWTTEGFGEPAVDEDKHTVTYTATWSYQDLEAVTYTAVYQFASADGTALPQAVLDCLPSDVDDEGNAKTYSSVDELEKANPIALTDDQKIYIDTVANPDGRVWTTEGFGAPAVDEDKHTVTYTAVWSYTDPKVETHTSSIVLGGDILIGKDSGNSAVHKVKTGDSLAYTGRLDVTPIINQIKEIASGRESMMSSISTKDVSSTFTASLTAPEGLQIDADAAKTATLTDNNLFKVSGVTVNGRTVTVTMILKKEYTVFKDLFDDVTSVPSTLDVTVPGYSISATAPAGTQYTVTGELTGSFSATATASSTVSAEASAADASTARKALAKAPASVRRVDKYQFTWHAEQTAEGKDYLLKDDADSKAIQYTVEVEKNAPEDVSGSVVLGGDILIGNDTEHDAIHMVKTGESYAYIGRLNVKPITDQIKEMAKGYEDRMSSISTSGVSSTFTATLTAPAGLQIDEDAAKKATLTDNKLFKVSGVKVDGRTVTVTMILKNDNYTSFEDLYNDVTSVSDLLDVTVPGYSIGSTTPAGTQYTVTGTVEGSFTGTAEIAEANKTRNYDYTWKAEQTAEGKDYLLKDDADSKAIQYTVEVKKNDPENVTGSVALGGDILIGDDTEHDAIHMVKTGESYAYIGRLNVKPITDQIKEMAKGYEDRMSSISTSGVSSTFTATLTAPEGLQIDPAAAKKATLTDNKLFKVSGVKVDGRTVTVTMILKNDNYTSFEDLYNDVTSVSDLLDVTVPGYSIGSTPPAGRQYTVTGTVEEALPVPQRLRRPIRQEITIIPGKQSRQQKARTTF